MKNNKLLLSALALATLAGCPGPTTVTDSGSGNDAGVTGGDSGPRDGGGTGGDTGPSDAGGGGGDAGPALDCTLYCTTITTNCQGANAQYTDMAQCMTQCTGAAWTVGHESDTSGNTLGCRFYHATAAMTLSMPAVHCPHASLLGGGQCSPFRTDPAVESSTATGYVRVDRMGMPAVATALVGTADTTAAMRYSDKDNYNDSNPTEDSEFTVSGPGMLMSLGAIHALLDADLIAHGVTPCSATRTVPALGAMVPICAAQNYNGQPLGSSTPAPVATLIIPDTLRFDPTATSAFPNGRNLPDDVIDPTLAVLLVSLTPCNGIPAGEECGGLAMAACTAAGATHCTWNAVAGTCGPAATSPVATCGALSMANCGTAASPTCTWSASTGPSGTCVPIYCELLQTGGAACGAAIPGCVASTCGAGTCGLTSIYTTGLNPHMNDATPSTTFPYFPAPHP
jgi:hypothetical protein